LANKSETPIISIIKLSLKRNQHHRIINKISPKYRSHNLKPTFLLIKPIVILLKFRRIKLPPKNNKIMQAQNKYPINKNNNNHNNNNNRNSHSNHRNHNYNPKHNHKHKHKNKHNNRNNSNNNL